MVDDLEDVVQQAVNLERASVAEQMMQIASTIRSVQQELNIMQKELSARIDNIRQLLGTKP
jgi:nitrogen fixation/metabolism regulation signal transduction histidine kinase